jgi:mRNA interferase MazF
MTRTMWRLPSGLLLRWTRFVRGDIYRLRAPKDARGHEQHGRRYAVVVQSDHVPLSTWLVAPTSTGRRAASFRPEIEIDGQRTRVMVEQTSAVDPETRLGEFAGRLSADEMRQVDSALIDVLGLR